MEDKYIRASFTKYIIQIAKTTSSKYFNNKYPKYKKELPLEIIEKESIFVQNYNNSTDALFLNGNLEKDYKNIENIFESIKICKAVKKLTETQKQVIYFSIIEEYTTEEVANIIGTIIDNIYQIKSRAIKKILNNLKGE